MKNVDAARSLESPLRVFTSSERDQRDLEKLENWRRRSRWSLRLGKLVMKSEMGTPLKGKLVKKMGVPKVGKIEVGKLAKKIEMGPQAGKRIKKVETA